jgi:hypothetical protein
MTVRVTPGKLLLSLAAIYPPAGAFVMDWNKTHIHNPNWPPHAEFHNAKTMSQAVRCAALTLWHIWRPGPETRSRLHWTVLFELLFVTSQAPAILFPGTDWADPDTPAHLRPRREQGSRSTSSPSRPRSSHR